MIVWREQFVQLRAVAAACLPLPSSFRGVVHADGWPEPIAATLAWAHAGFTATGFGQPLASVQRANPKKFRAQRLLAASRLAILRARSEAIQRENRPAMFCDVVCSRVAISNSS